MSITPYSICLHTGLWQGTSSCSQMFFKIGVLENFSIYTCAGVCFFVFNKVAGLQTCTFNHCHKKNKCYEGSLPGSDLLKGIFSK